jgi:tryptophan 7-halogenase
MNATAKLRELPQAVLIMGDGQLGILAAIALKRALPSSAVTVVPCERNPAIFADHIGTAFPFTNRLHDRLGIDELELVKKAGASHRLVTRYIGWKDNSEDGVSCYGSGAQSLGNAFTGQFAGVRPGQSEAEAMLTPAVALAMTGRFCAPDGDPHSPLASVDYALRWNIGGYRDLLIDMATRLGIQYVPHRPMDVERAEDGALRSVGLGQESGRIAADLFIDCSGPQRWLIGQMPGVAFESWADQLPCDRFLIAPPAEPVAALEDRLTLTAQGWTQEIGGRDGVHRIFGFSSALDIDAAEAEFMKSGATEAVAAAIIPGALAQPFLKNVIALGDAAASFEPLGGANLDLAHRQLSLLLELMPGKAIEAGERDEFNRRASLMAVAMRDWLGSHYAGLEGRTAPFAYHTKGMKRSASLTRLIDQHRRHGRLPFFEEAPMLSQEWSALLRATGTASRPSVHMQAQPASRYQALAQQAQAAARAAVDAAPPYLEWLTSVLPQNG